jgi:hypothetical protein
MNDQGVLSAIGQGRYTWKFEPLAKRLPAKEMRPSPSPRTPLLRA